MTAACVFTRSMTVKNAKVGKCSNKCASGDVFIVREPCDTMYKGRLIRELMVEIGQELLGR